MGDCRMSGSAWRIAAASAIGTSHLRLGTVCQDRFAYRIMKGADDGEVALLVASDGAGSASQAHEGAECAVGTVVEAVQAYLAAGNDVSRIAIDDARAWLAMVQQAISVRAADGGLKVRDYACTLLVAVLGAASAAFLQVGDGAIVASGEDGEWGWISWPQKGDYANTTNFVTEERAADVMEFDLVARHIDEVAVFTDGIESLVLHFATRTVHSPFFDKMFIPVRDAPAGKVDPALSAALEKYLNSPAVCERTDDDKTLILASRRLQTSSPESV
jgi:hypothetical protein